KDRENEAFLTRNRRGSPAGLAPQSSRSTAPDEPIDPARNAERAAPRTPGHYVWTIGGRRGERWGAQRPLSGSTSVWVSCATGIGSLGAAVAVRRPAPRRRFRGAGPAQLRRLNMANIAIVVI